MNYVSTELRRALSVPSIVSVHYFEYPVDFHYSGESHDFWELIYCDKGNLKIHAGETNWILSNGQAFLHPPKQYHNVCVADAESANSIILSFHSDSSELYQIADRILQTDSYTANALFSILRESQASFCNPLGKIDDIQLVRKKRSDYFASEQVIQNYIELLLIHLIRTEHFSELPKKASPNQLLENVILYMKENLHQKLTFPQIVAQFSVSPTTMKKLFRKYYSSGTMEYLIFLRIDHAKKLLREERYSCTEIAVKCGFCSIHHFSKAFKQYTNMSPTEYIKSVKAMLENTAFSSPKKEISDV